MQDKNNGFKRDNVSKDLKVCEEHAGLLQS